MENRDVQMVLSASALFHIYDKAGVGEISKYALLSFFSSIDKLITQQWLTKVLLEQGLPLQARINCEEFIKIMEALSNVPEPQTSSTLIK